MNPNSLTSPIFKGKGVDELELPTFHLVASFATFKNCGNPANTVRGGI